MSDGQGKFRFGDYADAFSAQAAFEATYPPGSPLEAAVQALVLMGAQCKSVGATRVACRFVENERALAGWCWHLALDGNAAKVIERVRVGLTALGA